MDNKDVISKVLQLSNTFSIMVFNPKFKELTGGHMLIIGTTLIQTPVQLILPSGGKMTPDAFIKKHNLDIKEFVIFQGILGSYCGKMCLIASGINNIELPAELTKLLFSDIVPLIQKGGVL